MQFVDLAGMQDYTWSLAVDSSSVVAEVRKAGFRIFGPDVVMLTSVENNSHSSFHVGGWWVE